MITFSRKSFPQSVEAFQGLDGIIIDSFDTGQLSKEQKRALRKWVKKSGGKLLLTGGSQQEGSKDSLERILVSYRKESKFLLCLIWKEKRVGRSFRFL